MQRLTVSLLVVVLLATIGLGWMFDSLYSQYSNNQATLDSNEIVAIQQVGIQLAEVLDKLPAKNEFVQFWNSEGQYSLEIQTLSDFQMPSELAVDLKNGQPLLLETGDTLALHYYLPRSGEILVLKAALPDSNQPLYWLSYLLTVIFYIALLTTFLFWVYPLIRQLLLLQKAAKKFGEGDLEQRVQIGSMSYIHSIETEFNHMAQRIGDLVGDVKLLGSAVSHDLRTPLARIRFGIDTLQEENNLETRRKYERKISDNVDEMTSLVETLLNYSRLDQAIVDVKKDKIDFGSLVTNCVNNALPESVTLHFEKPNRKMEICGDESYLSMLVNNLLLNALFFCDHVVKVKLSENIDHIALTVADDGEGVPDEQQEAIFKPFIRGTHQEKVSKGHGIGLAISKRIASWHRGDIAVSRSEDLPGAEFTLTLPKA